uniref:Uncharacterized protein n=1 Tax=Nelumbo nucifera TaxID=4432 RepID=A0A822YFQ3_NELNU|nr:TPA_asm: hypothetical protein HUJ06_009152 [Nelumbo nucifera]DAD32959.1 TPA_asm: hypothetical protein HUJ06_011810 [Nelumbo nucifera]
MTKGISSGTFYSRASPCFILSGSETKSLPFGGRKYGKIAAGSIVSVRVPLRVFSASASVVTSEKPSSASEIALRHIKDVSGTIKFPCSMFLFAKSNSPLRRPFGGKLSLLVRFIHESGSIEY